MTLSNGTPLHARPVPSALRRARPSACTVGVCGGGAGIKKQSQNPPPRRTSCAVDSHCRRLEANGWTVGLNGGGRWQ
jgi:hypothetical protein